MNESKRPGDIKGDSGTAKCVLWRILTIVFKSANRFQFMNLPESLPLRELQQVRQVGQQALLQVRRQQELEQDWLRLS